MDNNKIFIGHLSKKTNVPVKTIRYYEDLGLLNKPTRSFSSYRLYSERDIEKLLFIKKAKELGLTLMEIKEVLERSHDGLKETCCLVREVFNRKIVEYEDKIKELTQLKAKLEQKLQSWVEPKDAKKLKFTVCPQIETDERKVRHGKPRKKSR